MRTHRSSYRRAAILAGIAAWFLLIATWSSCGGDSRTGMWIRILCPDTPIDLVHLDISAQECGLMTSPLDEGEITLLQARTFDESSQEPENQLWVLIYAGQDDDIRIYLCAKAYRKATIGDQPKEREVATGQIEVKFTPGKIVEGQTPLGLIALCTDRDRDTYCADDCDDNDPTIHPGAMEVCGDAKDMNCDGTSQLGCPCSVGPGEPNPRVCWPQWAPEPKGGPCQKGTQLCANGVWEECKNIILPEPENCPPPYICDVCRDGIDNDCDGRIDATDTGCGGCEDGQLARCYTGPPETENIGICHGGQKACVNGVFGACQNEVTPTIDPVTQNPSELGLCDGYDNDCSGMADDNIDPGQAPSCSNQVGVCQGSRQTCQRGNWQDCSGEDYNQHSQNTFGVPYMSEGTAGSCDGFDNDCDGVIDPPPCTCVNGSTRNCSQNIGECRAGSFVCVDGAWQKDSQCVLPGAEACDGKDSNCDGRLDETDPDAANWCLLNNPGMVHAVLNCTYTANISAWQCGIASCEPGWDNCDQDASNGCETEVTTVANCGSCGHACINLHGGITCSNGQCAVLSCDAQWDNCDEVAANGCETPLTGPTDCSVCHNDCTALPNNLACVNGSCGCNTIEDCPTGGAVCYQQSCCLPQCSGLCGGASDSCGGFCNSCPGGSYCSGQSCLACANNDSAHCGLNCANCEGQPNNKVCINGQCGCNSISDCESGRYCTNNTCEPCQNNDSTACGPSCVNCQGQSEDRRCVNGVCGCTGAGDCNSNLSQVCYNNDCCLPNCAGKCGGVSDGCGGSCNASCGNGNWCNNGACQTCNTAYHCGADCTSCASNSSNKACVGGTTCGCIGVSDCNTLLGEICYNSSCCLPSCAGKCAGASDGCDGTCSSPCPLGQWCNGQTCSNCDVAQHCGPIGANCVDCSAQSTNKDCVNRRCGCDGAGADCASGEQCNTSTSLCQCQPNCSGKCNDATDGCTGFCNDPCPSNTCCNNQACVDFTQSDHCGANCFNCAGQQDNRACIDNSGTYTCGCNGIADCAAPNTCDDNAHTCGCTPDCTGKCNGASDGCTSTCNDACAGNTCCSNQVCVDFTQADHCGSGCTNCFGQQDNKACVNNAGTYTCGCSGSGDCNASVSCCYSQACVDFTQAIHCGANCTVCTSQQNDYACVNDSGSYRCGCNDLNDCDTGNNYDCDTGTQTCYQAKAGWR